MRRIVALIALLTTAAFLAGKLFAPARAQQAPQQQSSSPAPHPIVIAGGQQMSDIRAIAVDAAGNVFISAEISPAPSGCVARSVVGRVSVALFSNCTTASGEYPSGIAATSDGSGVFLANRAQNSIRLLDMLTGKVSLEPDANRRDAQTTKTSSPGTSQFTLAGPAGLAADVAQNLYIADRGNNRVLRLAAAGGDFTSVAHVLDAAAVAVNPGGREIFVASPASNRVFRIDATADDIGVFAGTGAPPASPADSAAQFPAPVPAMQVALAAPEGVAADAGGNIFIADTYANAILRVDAKTNLLSRVALGSDLNSPGGLAIDRRGDLFVADRGNHRVVEFAGVAQPEAAGSVTLTPASFTYPGAQPTGGTTAPQTFVLTNNSSSALSLATNDFGFAGNDASDFMQTNNCVPQLAVGSSCQVFVTFGPQGMGARAASLMVTDSDTSSPQTASLSGTGDTFNLTAANQNAMMQTVVPGGTGTYSLSVTPDNVFGGTVSLSCPTQLPNGTDNTLGCSINPPQLTITPGQPSSFSVMITTQSGKTPQAMGFRGFRPRRFWPDGFALVVFLITFALALAAAMLMGKERMPKSIVRFRQPRRIWATCALAFFCAAGAAGCYNSSTKYIPATPPGVYPIAITGTAQGAARSITLTLNVE